MTERAYNQQQLDDAVAVAEKIGVVLRAVRRMRARARGEEMFEPNLQRLEDLLERVDADAAEVAAGFGRAVEE